MTAGHDQSMHVHTAIVGAGFGGLGAAIRLKERGHDDFVILERADDLGGTWRDNSYPGCACDVESHLYSFSFAPKPDWTHSFSSQPEIWQYLRDCAARFGLGPHLRLGHDVTRAEWDDDAQRWRLATTRGEVVARVLVMATGPLSEPLIPELPGIASFRGAAFHSSRWDHDVDLAGKRVAVIGTGASAVQFVPRLQPRVAQLHLFQRTAAWVLPRPGGPVPPWLRRLYRLLPPVQRGVRALIYGAHELVVFLMRSPALMRRAQWVAKRHLERTVADPALRAKLMPSYVMGCKRFLLSNDYLPALTRPNVEVVTTGIAEVRPHGIVDVAGVERPVDVIVFGTGFQPTDPPLAHAIVGRDGRTLAEVWEGSPRAHLGTTVGGFPNLFLLLGPNTGLGHTSVVYMIEAQLAHLVDAVEHMRRHRVAAVEPTRAAQDAWNARIERRMRGTVWVAGHCRSWYLDRTGRNSTIWPDFTWRFRRRVARFDPAEYVLHAMRADDAPREVTV